MSTYPIRKQLVDIARKDVGKTEDTKNQAPWIAKLWPATSYEDGFRNKEPYCAAGLAYCLREWLKLPNVLAALGMDSKKANSWRCKSARAFDWEGWARTNRLQILPKNSILKTADIVIYKYSHIELVTNDDGTESGPFVAIGYNTNSAGSRDGEGAYEKPRSRTQVKCFVRILA